MVRNDIREKQPPKNTNICEQQKLPDSIYFGGGGTINGYGFRSKPSHTFMHKYTVLSVLAPELAGKSDS